MGVGVVDKTRALPTRELCSRRPALAAASGREEGAVAAGGKGCQLGGSCEVAGHPQEGPVAAQTVGPEDVGQGEGELQGEAEDKDQGHAECEEAS